jgi:dienelactone hydrolase
MQFITLPAPVKTPWERNNRIPALLIPAVGTPRAGMLMLHGYTGSKSTMLDEARLLSSWGFTVLVPDLPLHGERTIEPGGMFQYPYYGDPEGIRKAFELAVGDVRTCADHLREVCGPETPLSIAGFSLGGCLTILSMAKLPGVFSAGLSLVGAAKVARLIMTSTIAGDIQQDLLSLGYDEQRLEPLYRPVEATETPQNIHNLLLIGGSEDLIVPSELVLETYQALEHETNRCRILPGYGHFIPLDVVMQLAVPFLSARL